jgi:hypothetical protein
MKELLEITGLNLLSTGDLVVFCGAGISYHSGLPLANQLKQYVLEKLTNDKDDISEIIKTNQPFESFVEIIFRNYVPPFLVDEEADPVTKAAAALYALSLSMDGNVTSGSSIK